MYKGFYRTIKTNITDTQMHSWKSFVPQVPWKLPHPQEVKMALYSI